MPVSLKPVNVLCSSAAERHPDQLLLLFFNLCVLKNDVLSAVKMKTKPPSNPPRCVSRRHRVRRDGGRRLVLHVAAGQLEPGVPDDGGPMQTQQPGVRRKALHHRRSGHVGQPGPRGEVGTSSMSSVCTAGPRRATDPERDKIEGDWWPPRAP